MNFLNLYYFSIAAEELNFTKAAKRLFISQQSLSNHISRLESEFGVVLFNRTQPVTLTDAGETLYRRSQNLLDEKKQLETAMQDLRDFRKGELTIGISTSRGAVMLPDILPEFHTLFPQIDLKLVEGNSSELADDLLHGNIDLIIDMLPFKVENVETVPICEEEILLAVPDSVLEHAFPGRLKEIKKQLSEHTDLKLLANCPFLLINKGNRVRTIADEMFEEAQITPNIVLETENIQTVLALAEKGMGITFYPRMFISGQTEMQELKNGQGPLNFYSLDHPKAHGVLAIGYHKGHYMSQATKEFIQTAKETI